MRVDRAVAFPFGEFDPILRRDLSAVLEAARRDVEAARRVAAFALVRSYSADAMRIVPSGLEKKDLLAA